MDNKIRFRPQRLRANSTLRKLSCETNISVDDLIYPIFIKSKISDKQEIPSMPGIYQHSHESVLMEIRSAVDMGLNSFMLFGIPSKKDKTGSMAFSDEGVIQIALKKIKKEFPDVFLITDLCMCEYTSHGHCGILKDNKLDNDETLKYLKKQALSHLKFGSDMIAPSGMIDGSVKILREFFDKNNFQSAPIMSYSAKYASSFYGPFRHAAESAPEFGDRKTYQMNPANKKEAIKEVLLDIKEGADIVMVKPALSYLDVISNVKDIVNTPVAAYNVSGEYSMVKAASKMNWIDEKLVREEILLSIKRSGADMIITYFAKDFANSALLK
tara:strand:+ start:378 stop:1358 length:981 start_codon:yes stop_codon:yes gene_type:complete